MDTSKQGYTHIHNRTSMTADDVLSLLSSNNTITLGEYNGEKFILFYSTPDHCCKIAVLSEGKLSIHKSNYVVPASVSEVSDEMRVAAQSLARSYIFKKFVSPQSFTGVKLTVQLEVRAGPEIQFRMVLGTIPEERTNSLEQVICAFKESFDEIWLTVEANKRRVAKGALRYIIYCIDKEGTIFEKFYLKHKAAKRFVQPPE